VVTFYSRVMALGFIGNEVAREEFDDSLCCADERSYVEADVNGAGYQALLLYLVTRQPKSKD
jgi:hypothetical protein